MRRGGLVMLLVMLAAIGIAGCISPGFNYAANTSDHTYFKVPTGWSKVSTDELASALNGGQPAPISSGLWLVGYDASSSPTARDATNSAADKPFVTGLVEHINQTATSSLSYDGLRDFFLPVTSGARQSAAASGFPLTNFHLLQDQMLTPGQGVHGVREVFQYTYPGGVTDTFDQVALTNADATVVYALMLHCTTGCYQHQQSQINTVMKSFTVRSP
ncbi:MAG TPA: hypothetical protein VGI64_08120 [Streptosporangiaceae bacterium]|jgi:hypothetical protein